MLEKELPRATVTNKSRRLARGELSKKPPQQLRGRGIRSDSSQAQSRAQEIEKKSNYQHAGACRQPTASPHGSAEQEKQHNAEERGQGMGMEGAEEGRKGRPDDLVYRRLDRTADKRAADSGREQIMEDEDGASHLSETLSLLIVLCFPWFHGCALCCFVFIITALYYKTNHFLELTTTSNKHWAVCLEICQIMPYFCL